MKDVRVHYDNLAKHGVTEAEALQCVQTDQKQYRHRVRKGVYRIIAQTMAGRYLEVLYTEDQDEVFVFHAMDAKRQHKKLLKRKGKRR